VKICRFPRAALEAVSNEQPQLKQRLLDVAVADLVSAQAQIAIMGRQTATEKVASFLLMLARKAAENGRRNNLIQLPMTREDIGDFLGLAFETVSRCLTRLEELHLIALESPRTVRINDFRALEDYFEKK
jgi:CRP/FNR family transcriptional regulator